VPSHERERASPLGWRNDPASPNNQKLTSPEHGPMDAWKKWSLLG